MWHHVETEPNWTPHLTSPLIRKNEKANSIFSNGSLSSSHDHTQPSPGVPQFSHQFHNPKRRPLLHQSHPLSRRSYSQFIFTFSFQSQSQSMVRPVPGSKSRSPFPAWTWKRPNFVFRYHFLLLHSTLILYFFQFRPVTCSRVSSVNNQDILENIICIYLWMFNTSNIISGV